MINTLDKVDELAQALKAVLPMNPQYQQKLDKKFRLEFNYNSNHMEGNTLTYGETELLLIFNETKGNHTLREYEEMKGHDVAIKLIEEWAGDKEHPLTESYIKNLNQVILKEPFWKEAITADGQNTRRLIKIGNYKEFPNSVRLQNGELFNYASPAETPILMQELLNWYRSEESTLHPVTLAAMLHYKFVRIHPFDDGNGRIARLLMNYVLLKNNLPPIIIKAKDKQNYLRALHLADVGNFEPFIDYIANQLVWSLEISISSARGENIEEFEDLDKELFVLQQELKNENVLKTSANAEIIFDTIEENIIPLFILTEEKLVTLKEYFFDFNRRIEYELDDQNGTFIVGTKNSRWEQLKENWLTKQIRAEMKKVKNIKYNYELKGFRKTVSAPSFWLNLEIYFYEYNYTIQTERNRNQPAQMPYGQKLSNIELQNFITPLIKEIIERIKQANGNH